VRVYPIELGERARPLESLVEVEDGRHAVVCPCGACGKDE
jgi:hypothetical protein